MRKLASRSADVATWRIDDGICDAEQLFNIRNAAEATNDVAEMMLAIDR